MRIDVASTSAFRSSSAIASRPASRSRSPSSRSNELKSPAPANGFFFLSFTRSTSLSNAETSCRVTGSRPTHIVCFAAHVMRPETSRDIKQIPAPTCFSKKPLAPASGQIVPGEHLVMPAEGVPSWVALPISSASSVVGNAAPKVVAPPQWLATQVDALHDALFAGAFANALDILASIPLDPPAQPRKRSRPRSQRSSSIARRWRSSRLKTLWRPRSIPPLIQNQRRSLDAHFARRLNNATHWLLETPKISVSVDGGAPLGISGKSSAGSQIAFQRVRDSR